MEIVNGQNWGECPTCGHKKATPLNRPNDVVNRPVGIRMGVDERHVKNAWDSVPKLRCQVCGTRRRLSGGEWEYLFQEHGFAEVP